MRADLTPQDLMKAMGSRSGYFDPIPPDQHAWPMKNGYPPLFKLWSWMCAHTIRKGRRKGYVCDERGRALTLEDAASDLGMDEGVCRRAWREGAALGLWRKGTNAADRKQLFLNAKVIPVPVEADPEPEIDAAEEDDSNTKKGEEKEKEVCTDLFPPYISKQIKRLPKVRREVFLSEHARNERLKLDVHADVTVAVRLIFDQRENSMFSRFGIKKIREEHKPKNGAVRSPERIQLVQEFLPGLEKFVETVEKRSVQAFEESVQTEKDPAVQTAGKAPKNGVTPEHGNGSGDGIKRAVLEPQRTSLPSAVSHPINRNNSSVGRSSLTEEPTDRPNGHAENPFKPKIREWLTPKFKSAIPGFDLEETELEQIAATIHTEAHLEQFQKAALRQKDPRGWIVFVTIAQNCEKQHAGYEKAMTAGGGEQPAEDERMRKIAADVEARKKWR